MASGFLDRVSNKALGELLVEKGALSQEQVDEALGLSRSRGVRLGEALVSLGYISQDSLGYTIGEQYGLQPMELHPSMVDADLVSRFDYGLLSAHTMLPLIEIGEELIVVVADPNDKQGLAELARILPQHTITPQLGAAEQIRRCLHAVMVDKIHTTNPEEPAETRQPIRSIELRSFDEQPSPDSDEFVEYLLFLAASNASRDVLIRELDGELQIALTPSAGVPASSPDSALQHVGQWQGVGVADVRHKLLQRAIMLEHTRGQAAKWKAPVALNGSSYDLLILMPITAAGPICRLRALQYLENGDDDVLIPLAPNLEAGKYTVVLYDETVPLERALEQFMEANAAEHTFAMCQLATRCVFPHAEAYPAPFANMVGAVQATAATCVVIDHPVEYREARRLLTSTYPPPAVLVCAPLPSHEAGAGSLSPDVEELMARQGAQSIRLDTSLHPQTENSTRGSN